MTTKEDIEKLLAENEIMKSQLKSYEEVLIENDLIDECDSSTALTIIKPKNIDAGQNKIRTGKKASQQKLNDLHDLLADYFADALDSGEDLSSGTLAAINTFLKNNNVTADFTDSNPMQNFSEKIKLLIQD